MLALIQYDIPPEHPIKRARINDQNVNDINVDAFFRSAPSQLRSTEKNYLVPKNRFLRFLGKQDGDDLTSEDCSDKQVASFLIMVSQKEGFKPHFIFFVWP